MHPQVTHALAKQHIADLRRAADHNRLAHAATTAAGRHAVPAASDSAGASVSFLRRLRRLVA